MSYKHRNLDCIESEKIDVKKKIEKLRVRER